MGHRTVDHDLEYAMFDELVRRVREEGGTEITGRYLPTAKNRIVKDFYASLGFTKTSENTEGQSEWRFVIPDDYIQRNSVIRIEHENGGERA